MLLHFEQAQIDDRLLQNGEILYGIQDFKEYGARNTPLKFRDTSGIGLQFSLPVEDGKTIPSLAVKIENESDASTPYFLLGLNQETTATLDDLLIRIGVHAAQSDREKAHTIYNFLAEKTSPGMDTSISGTPTYSSPVHALAISNRGQCVWSGKFLVQLAQAAGLQARNWFLPNAHSFPEVYYDNAWHILDPDLGTTYNNYDHAGFKFQVQHPLILQELHGQFKIPALKYYFFLATTFPTLLPSKTNSPSMISKCS